MTSQEKWNGLLREVMLESGNILRGMFSEGKGSAVVGNVAGRISDEEIEADTVAEKLLIEKLKNAGFGKVSIETEHNDFPVENPDFYISMDPMDGTAFFKRGIPHFVFIGIGVFDRNFQPVTAMVYDVFAETLFYTENEKAYSVQLSEENEISRKMLVPSKETELSEKSLISANIFKSVRIGEFASYYPELLRINGGGMRVLNAVGPATFAYLAGGNICAFLTKKWLRGETDPGFYLAKCAGCSVRIIENGKLSDYSFKPGAKNERFDILASANTELEKNIFETIKEQNAQ